MENQLAYIITGASRGLGLEFVKQISAAGHIVFACARNPDSSKGLTALVDNKKVFAIKLDTTDKASIQQAAEQIDQLAPQGVDVLINNAGISGDISYTALNTPSEQYISNFNTNVVGTVEVTSAFLPLLRKRGKEHVKKILNMSSILGSLTIREAVIPDNSTAYSVSKTALNMVTRLQAHELAEENFIVYSAHPGWVATEMGGENAPVHPVDSIKGMLAVLDKLEPKDNGKFIDFEGKNLPW